MECLKPGGRLVINAIRKESGDQDYLYRLDYSRHLWMEKEIKSVANVTANDVREFIRIAALPVSAGAAYLTISTGSGCSFSSKGLKK